MDGAKTSNFSFSTEDRQWDARFNVQLDSDLERLIEAIRQDYGTGKLSYVLVGGVEIGTKPYQDDYQIKHVHVAAMFKNRVSKRAILKNWGIKTGNGYYLVPRNRNLPYSGWKTHHIKEFSKVDPGNRTLVELGELPKDHASASQGFVKRSEEEKKRKIDDVLIDMKQLIDKEQCEEAFRKWPRTYLQYGEKLKAMVLQTRDKLTSTGDPHMWVHGAPGAGKSAVLNYIYPKYYKKNLYNKFFDLYDPKEHTHVMLEDLDHDCIDKLSLNFVKTLCDEAGFPIDQKYKTPQLSRATILVTSNFTITEVVSNSAESNPNARASNAAALHRRFMHINISELLRLLGVKLLPRYEINMLKKSGNTDPGKLFISWDYLNDMPLCEPIEGPEAFAKKIKDTYFDKKE